MSVPRRLLEVRWLGAETPPPTLDEWIATLVAESGPTASALVPSER